MVASRAGDEGEGSVVGDAEETEVFLVVDAEDLDAAESAAAANGVEVEQAPTMGFEPVTTVTLVLLGTSLAIAAVLDAVERHKGGQVIDLRPSAIRPFSRSKDVAYGLVLIVATDGTIQVEVKEPKGLFLGVVEQIKGILGDVTVASVSEVSRNLTQIAIPGTAFTASAP